MKFFQRLFRTPEEHVTLKQAKEMFEMIKTEKQNEKQHLIEGFNSEIKENIELLEKSFNNLANAKLMNDKLYPKERAIMEGNLKSYLHYGEILIKRLKRTNEVSELSDAINAFSAPTIRNFNVLLEFFETEVKEIAKGIRQINELITEKAQKTMKSRENRVEQFFEELNKIDENRKRLNKEQKEKKKEIKQIKEQIQKIKQDLGELKNSDEVKEYNLLEENLNNKQKKQKSLEYQIYHTFFQFSKYFRKLYNLSEDKTLKSLIDEPVATFLEKPDDCFKFLEELRIAVKKTQISVKNDQKKKILERLANIDENKIKSVRKNFKEIQKDSNNLRDKIHQFTVFDKIDDKHYQLKVLERKLSEIKMPNDEDFDFEKRKILKQIQSGLSHLTKKKIILDVSI